MRIESMILSLISGDDCHHPGSVPGVEGRRDQVRPAQLIVIVVVSTAVHANLQMI